MDQETGLERKFCKFDADICATDGMVIEGSGESHEFHGARI